MSQTLLNSLGAIGTLSNVTRHSAEIASLIGDNQPAGITTTDETIEDPSTFDILAMSKDDIRLSRALSVAPNIDFYTYKVSFKLGRNS